MATSLAEALASGKFLATASVDPPKGTDLAGLGQLLQKLKGVVDGLGVSDNHQGIMCMSPWAVCKLALEEGLEPIMHMTCRDRNRLALQSDLLAAASLGIRNVLCVSGDHVRFGDHVNAKPVHDIDSVHLLEAAKGLAKGKDMAGNTLEAAVEFFLGGVANPEADPLEPQLIKVDKKIKAGASFLVTHPVFNMENLKRFMEHVRQSQVKILVGVRLLDPQEVPKYRDGGYPGLFVPEKLLEKTEGADIDKCTEMAAAAVKEIKGANLCDGVHIVAPGHEEKIPEILKAAGV
ncbi:MAG: methylenetetrahydrofolate reductase [Thermodesulfobacteriota bacterium]|nr:methylenetetrahydrofolate reductase [Thermodesulfobacteriota bacterium]